MDGGKSRATGSDDIPQGLAFGRTETTGKFDSQSTKLLDRSYTTPVDGQLRTHSPFSAESGVIERYAVAVLPNV